MTPVLGLPIIDLSSQDRLSTAESIRQACLDHGFFYVVNHGVEKDLLNRVFEESKKFFALLSEEKMKLERKEHRGYSPLYVENFDPSASDLGDAKESFYIGPLAAQNHHLNQWPSEEILPSWKPTMESYYKKVLSAGTKVISLLALALRLDEDFFEKLGAVDDSAPFLRLLRYPGIMEDAAASAHSDYGMITLLATDGVQGLQVCRDKTKQPQLWEEVPSICGAFIVNIGDMMERWTNCLFRSTLHRVMPTGKERYSIAFFIDPKEDCVVECLTSCCSESSSPRFPPICSGDYLRERFRLTYGNGA